MSEVAGARPAGATIIWVFESGADGEGAVDRDRGLRFVVTSGYKDGSYAGWVTADDSRFKLRVRPDRDRYPAESPAGLAPEEFMRWAKEHENLDYRVRLAVGVPLFEGEWNRPEMPLDLAREIAVAMEIHTYRTERWRILIG